MKLQLNKSRFSILCLPQTPCSCPPLFFQQQTDKNHQIQVLKNLTRLLNVVIKQEKKYKYRLLPYSKFYCQHLIIEQFFQIQFKIQPSQTRKNLFLIVSCVFG